MRKSGFFYFNLPITDRIRKIMHNKNKWLVMNGEKKARANEAERIALERISEYEGLNLGEALALCVKQAAGTRGLITRIPQKKSWLRVKPQSIEGVYQSKEQSDPEAEALSALQKLQNYEHLNESEAIRLAVREGANARKLWPIIIPNKGG